VVIPDASVEAKDYCSWDASIDEARHAILGMYDRPLFRLVGHRKRAWHTAGPAVSVTVLWHHVISDGHSDDVVKRDINALVRGETLRQADLTGYHVCAMHPLAKPALQPVCSGVGDMFSLPRRAGCDFGPFRSKVFHSVCMMAAVSRRPFAQDVDRARFFLDAFCATTGQMRGRLGLLTNARTQVNRDLSNLIGALLFHVEYSYDSTTGTLESLGRATDAASGLGINVHGAYGNLTAPELLSKYGFEHSERICAGDPTCSMKTIPSGAFGANFGAGEGFYVECFSVADATVFLTIYPDALFDGMEVTRELHRRLSVA